MKKKRTGAALKAQVEEKKPKVTIKHETSEEEESETEVIEEVEEEEEEEIEEEEEEEEEEDEDEEEEEEEEEEDESSKKETLRKLLEPLSKEKIIDFLKQAALNDRSILATLTETAEVDPAHRNIFVYGLGWDATSDQVLSVFKPYGEIEECKVVMDKVTGKAKGYGFVLFKTRKSARKALKQTQKKIGSRMASCQLASEGPGGPGNNQTGSTATSDPIGRKIFVANVGSHVNPNALKSYFMKFGEIEDGPLGMDNGTGKFKGFAMFLYKTVDGCKKALEEPNKVFDGCQLHCRQAVDGQRGNKNSKRTQLGMTNSSGTLPQSEIGNMGYGYGGVYGGGPQIMIGQNPMLVSGLSQNSVTPVQQQSFGVGGGYGISYGSQLGLAGLGTYQNNSSQVRSTGGTTAGVTGRQQSGVNFPSYHLGR